MSSSVEPRVDLLRCHLRHPSDALTFSIHGNDPTPAIEVGQMSLLAVLAALATGSMAAAAALLVLVYSVLGAWFLASVVGTDEPALAESAVAR
eukprot:132845-Amphidinium_carterae.2